MKTSEEKFEEVEVGFGLKGMREGSKEEGFVYWLLLALGGKDRGGAVVGG